MIVTSEEGHAHAGKGVSPEILDQALLVELYHVLVQQLRHLRPNTSQFKS